MRALGSEYLRSCFNKKNDSYLFYRQASLGDAALLGPLPPGWEETHTQEGQKYYMNHITKSTQWEDPRITVSQLPLHQNNQHVAQISGGPGGSLPHGWEQGTTPEGEIYYIDHSTHRTQWHDPRIPQSQQPNIPQRINNQGTSQQRLLQLQREKKAVLVRFLSLYIGKVVYFSNRNSSRIFQPSVLVGKISLTFINRRDVINRISWGQIFISLPKHNFRIVKC